MTQRAVVDISKEHALETYKSLIRIALDGFKLLALLNGGAAVALLAYLGNVAARGGQPIPMRVPMAFYIVGLVLCGVAYFVSSLTQFNLYNESVGSASRLPHTTLLRVAQAVALLSLAAFASGSLIAAFRFTG